MSEDDVSDEEFSDTYDYDSDTDNEDIDDEPDDESDKSNFSDCSEVVIKILAFYLRHNLTWTALEQLLLFMLGRSNVWEN